MKFTIRSTPHKINRGYTSMLSGNINTANLTLLVLVTYSFFMAGFFFIPNAVDQYKFYIAAVFLPGLFLLPKIEYVLRKNRLWIAILLYLGYMLCSSFWSNEFSIATLWYDLKLALYILAFLMITVTIDLNQGNRIDSILRFTGICSAIAAIISMPLWYKTNPFPDSRLIGIGTLENPNPSSFVYGFFSVLSSHYALQSKNILRKAVFLLCTSILLIFVFFTQSRTGILATLVSQLLLIAFYLRSKRVTYGILAIVGAAFIFYMLASPWMLSRLIDISFPNRIPIWEHALDLIAAAPVFGNGYQTGFLAQIPDSTAVFGSAHNTFLATARDGGLVGLGLQLLVITFAFRAGLRALVYNNNPIYLVLLIFGLLCMLTATDQIITRPRELWIIFWLPLALLLARETCRTADKLTKRPSAHNPP
jgi:O-antigen ligase